MSWRIESLCIYADVIMEQTKIFLKELDRLKGVRGELIQQDPTDEPVSALFESIEVEHAAKVPKRSRKSKYQEYNNA